jgi:muramidase (phage lysozyme)
MTNTLGGGELVAASRIAVMLSRTGHPYSLKVGNTAFQDLSSSPSILIGYSSTQWQEVTRDLRYFIDDAHAGMIRDFGKATD